VIQPIKWVFNYIEDPRKLMFGSDYSFPDIVTNIKSYKDAYKKPSAKTLESGIL
jgi:hypothetical protein